MQRIIKLAISVLICFSTSLTKAEESYKVIVVASTMYKSRTLSLDESDFIARLYMHALTNGNNYPVIVVYEGEGNECALNDYDIKVDIFARKDRFKSLDANV